MSYDVYAEIDTGGEWPATVGEAGNMTSNCSGMWDLACKGHGPNLRDMHGMKCGDCIETLRSAVAEMVDPYRAAEFEALNPPNGWGSTDSALKYLRRVLAMCVEHPNAKVRISR